MPKLTIMCGLPRSGKSTWVEKYKGNAFVLSADMMRYMVYGQRFWTDGEPLMWTIHDILLRMLLEQHVDIIIDETNTTPKRREPYVRIGKKFGYSVECVYVNTSEEECLARAINNEDEIIQPVIARMAKEFVPPSLSEGFDVIIEVDSSGQIVET